MTVRLSFPIPVPPKCFSGQELEILLRQLAATGGFELHVEGVGHLEVNEGWELGRCVTWSQGTFSGTRNGCLPHSAKALSHRMVAQAWGSWLPWTITTTGSEGAQTCSEAM